MSASPPYPSCPTRPNIGWCMLSRILGILRSGHATTLSSTRYSITQRYVMQHFKPDTTRVTLAVSPSEPQASPPYRSIRHHCICLHPGALQNRWKHSSMLEKKPAL